ncbi:hypothetical protein MUNTM_10640 [Mycobacterium sp. MUNTM1]
MTIRWAESALAAEEVQATVEAFKKRRSAAVWGSLETCDQRFAVTNDMCFPLCGADGRDDVWADTKLTI